MAMSEEQQQRKMADERRQKRKEIRFIQSESVWLQKALFALHKAEAAHEKVADARDEETGDYTLKYPGGSYNIEAFESALEQRIEKLMGTVREMRGNLT